MYLGMQNKEADDPHWPTSYLCKYLGRSRSKRCVRIKLVGCRQVQRSFIIPSNYSVLRGIFILRLVLSYVQEYKGRYQMIPQ